MRTCRERLSVALPLAASARRGNEEDLTPLSTRDGAEFDRRSASLDALPLAPLTPEVLVAARNAFRELAHRHPLFHRSVALPDVIVAAAAATAGLGVLHYDADFDTLATVLPFESRWIAPRGSLD